MKKLTLLFSFLIIFSSLIIAQEDTTKTKKKIKKGFSFGGVPVVAYNSDIGFQYGLLGNIYHYGDGSRYPAYDHSIYLEWSRSTKGNGQNIFQYDSEKLIPNIRTTLEASYRTEKALNFYGFNGYNAFYNGDYEDDQHADYISRVFYRYQRQVVRLKADFQGNIIGRKLRWLAGITYMGSEIDTVDIDKLNEGKDDADKLPNVPGLYRNYVNWGLIKESEKDGGNNAYLKLGLVYDTRDNEPNPNKGMWTEALLFYGPSFFGFENSTASMLLLHRQYFTLSPDRLTFAYRLSYQTKLSGDIPFYLLPYYMDSKSIEDGFGGKKTLRGVLRNRIVGNGVTFANFEFRWKVLKTVVFNQNFYIALSAFTDLGRVVDPYKLDLSGVPATVDRDLWFNNKSESWHMSYGAGVHFALNENFIIAVDYGMAAKEEDGTSGLYIGLNFLY